MASTITSDLREIVAERVEHQMLGAEAANVAKLMATGLSFEAIREALIARTMGDADWKAGLR